MKARAILRELIAEVRNPDIANGPAAMRACLAAEQLFKEEASEHEKGSMPGTSSIRKPKSKMEVGSKPSQGAEKAGN